MDSLNGNEGKPEVDRDQLLDKVLSCKRLPSLPAIAIEVIELCRRQDINIQHIAKTISNDPALSTKILRTVNSSFYGLSQSVSTISHALVMLGLNSVKTLALGFSLIDTFRDQCGREIDMVGFWQRCLYAAVAARTIAQQANRVETEEAFLGGLLKDLGMMALLQTIPRRYGALLRETVNDPTNLWRIERKTFGIDHAQVGAALGEHWKLPDVLLTPIRCHERPETAPPAHQPMVYCVALGSRTANLFLNGDPDSVEEYFRLAEEWMGFDRETAESVINQVDSAAGEMGRLFNIQAQPQRDAQSILAEANETLLQLTLQTQQNATELESRNRELQAQMTRDSLTGVANRGHFNEFIDNQYKLASQNSTSLGVVFVDADKFKLVNDTHGHQAGDQVLIKLAQLLTAAVPTEGLVSRYGGEEFAIVLPAHDRRQSALVAEKLRLSVESSPIQCREDLTLNVTVSVGVASCEFAGQFRSPEQLVEAADRAVYAAKDAGRNCVRVFTPRNKKPAGA